MSTGTGVARLILPPHGGDLQGRTRPAGLAAARPGYGFSASRALPQLGQRTGAAPDVVAIWEIAAASVRLDLRGTGIAAELRADSGTGVGREDVGRQQWVAAAPVGIPGARPPGPAPADA